MVILLFLIFLTYSALNFRFSVIEFLSPLSSFFHQRCLYLLPSHVHDFPEMAALVCGHNFENAADAQIYKSSGLIHLFVVSGSHLVLLKKILEKVRLPTSVIFCFLIAYCFCSLLNPPVVRSCLFLLATLALKKISRLWPVDYILLLSGFLCLILNPYWVGSLSLQMSWIAGLVLACCSDLDSALRQMTFYFIFSLTYFGLGFPSPSIIPLSLFVSPVLEFVLFPLCLSATLFHFLEPLPKFLIEHLNSVLVSLEFNNSIQIFQQDSLNNAVAWNWLIIFLIHIYLYFKRKRHEENSF